MIQILIVEDEEMILKGLQYTVDWLSMNANVIAVAENGKIGLEKIREYSPDLVLTDIKMQVMDGLTMIEKAYEEGLQFLPVILTSYSDFSYAKESIRLQVFDYLLKPVNDAKLEDLVSRASIHLGKERNRRLVSELVGHNLIGSGKDNPNQGEASLIDSGAILMSVEVNNCHVKYALEKIKDEYKEHLSIDAIASELKISTSYLSRMFKQQCGQTFLDFLSRYRILKAIDLLRSGNYRVYEVASLCGFSEYKRFYQTFRKFTNIAPTEFLKNGCCIVKKSR
ncbi:MAG TPA: helix-turn-helix domain-containing protein [Treponemataceae bacterium]|nr:helix-turn-helix domain-containing protein [Treponemataceae bacterium]